MTCDFTASVSNKQLWYLAGRIFTATFLLLSNSAQLRIEEKRWICDVYEQLNIIVFDIKELYWCVLLCV
ncbi:hypothetical protein M5689_023849 [Euphorbia peplus]|nr:hypothetical protein M5689_023849 [Euphorbia peplus]